MRLPNGIRPAIINERYSRSARYESVDLASKHPELEDELLESLRGALKVGRLTPRETGELLVYWGGKSEKLVSRRLLIDLYRLLEIGSMEQAKELLGTLADAPESFTNRDNHNAHFARYCGNLVSILETSAESYEQIQSTVEGTRRTLYEMARTQAIVVAGAEELHELYARFRQIVDEYVKWSRSSSILSSDLRPTSFLRPVVDDVHLAWTEHVHDWLDRLSIVDPVHNPAGHGSVGIFRFYLDKAAESFRSAFGVVALAEYKLCRDLLALADSICRKSLEKPNAWITASTHNLSWSLYNLAGLRSRFYVECFGMAEQLIEVDCFSRHDSQHVLSVDDLCVSGWQTILGPAVKDWKSTLIVKPIPLSIFVPTNDVRKECWPVKRLSYEHEYNQRDEEAKTWLFTGENGSVLEWWREVTDSLGQGGRNKIIYGMPRVGKTTGVLHHLLHSKIENNSGIDIVPIYINLATLLPGDDAGQDLTGFRRSLTEQIEIGIGTGHFDTLFRDVPVDDGASQANFNTYLRLASRQCPAAIFVVFVDEWTLLREFHPRLMRRLAEVVAAINANRAWDSVFVYCATGVPDRKLIDEYQFVKQTDWSMIAARPFDQPQVRTSLDDWIRPASEDASLPTRKYDDLAICDLYHYTGGHPLLLQVFAHHVSLALIDGRLGLPISWLDVERMWTPLLRESSGAESDFVRFRIDMAGVLETIWLGLSEEDKWKLRRVVEGRSWQYLQLLLDCGLVRLNEMQQPVLGIEALYPWYNRWLISQ